MAIIGLIFIIIIFLFSVVLHEVAHGWTANLLGDPTAKNMGRLSLNPLRHLDPFGSVLLPLLLIMLSQVSGNGFVFGWAKPVPYNPLNLRNQKRDPALVAAAGSAINLTIALIFGLLSRAIIAWQGANPSFYWVNLTAIFAAIVWVNLLLGIFNLIPIPPLDGSKILFAFLPRSLDHLRFTIERYGFIILLAFIFFGFSLIIPLISFLFQLLVGQSFS